MAAARPMGNKSTRKDLSMSDDEVLEARALREFRGWRQKQLEQRYPHVDPRTLNQILNYNNRSRLIPTESHLPEEAR